MRLWRICRAPFAENPLSGKGGLFASGRWHGRGRRVVYTSATLSLAALEMLAHVDRDNAPDDLVRIEIEPPEGAAVERVRRDRLPAGWRTLPAPAELKRLGNEWLDGRRTPLLEVPSSVVPEESNFLVNPEHPDVARFRVVSTAPFGYDPRLVER